MRASIALRRVFVVLTAAVVGVLGTIVPAAATSKVPYTDSDAHGYLGICNQQGHQITSGSTTSVPFAWEVVSSVAAPSGYSGTGRTATLFAYQPIEGLEPGDWSGEQITGTSRYTNPAHPIAVSTERDFALSQYLIVFPPKWDGFIELRLFLGVPGTEPDVLTYPALSLHISGDTWQAVGGGPVDCTAGQAVSNEEFLPTTTVAKGSPGSQSSSSPSTTSADKGSSTSPPTSSPGSSSSAGRGHGATGGDKALPALAASKSSNVIPLIVGPLVALILIALGAWIVIRARRRRVSPT